jgi:hypothetical protein
VKLGKYSISDISNNSEKRTISNSFFGILVWKCLRKIIQILDHKLSDVNTSFFCFFSWKLFLSLILIRKEPDVKFDLFSRYLQFLHETKLLFSWKTLILEQMMNSIGFNNHFFICLSWVSVYPNMHKQIILLEKTLTTKTYEDQFVMKRKFVKPNL